MITPTKGVRPDQSLLYIGGQILGNLDEPTTVSAAWEALARKRMQQGQVTVLTFDWYVMALDFLYALGAIKLSNGLITKVVRS
jgi:hypothetical protein